MDYKELILASLSKADEEPGDEIIDRVIEDAVNQGYLVVATSIDPIVDSTEVVYDDDGFPLPDDFHDVVEFKINRDLRFVETDYYISDGMLYFLNKDFKEPLDVEEKRKYTLRYSKYPEPLREETDVPKTRRQFDYAIILYAAYSLLLYKKRYTQADTLLSEFSTYIGGE